MRSIIIVLMLALAALAPASGEAAAFSPGDVLTSRYAYGIIGVDPTDGSQTVITGSDSYSFRGVVIAPDGDLLVINWLAPDPELVRINPTDGTETVITPGGLITEPWAMAMAPNGGPATLATHSRGSTLCT